VAVLWANGWSTVELDFTGVGETVRGGDGGRSRAASIARQSMPAEREVRARPYQRMRRENKKLHICLSRVIRDEQRDGGKITSDGSARGPLSLMTVACSVCRHKLDSAQLLR
jgi:hypothetical protein